MDEEDDVGGADEVGEADADEVVEEEAVDDSPGVEEGRREVSMEEGPMMEAMVSVCYCVVG